MIVGSMKIDALGMCVSVDLWGGDNFVNNVPPGNLRGEFAQGGRQQHADIRRRF